MSTSLAHPRDGRASHQDRAWFILCCFCITDDGEVDSFIGQSASSTEQGCEVLQSAAVLDSTTVDSSFSASTTLPSTGQLFLLLLLL